MSSEDEQLKVEARQALHKAAIDLALAKLNGGRSLSATEGALEQAAVRYAILKDPIETWNIDRIRRTADRMIEAATEFNALLERSRGE